MVLIHLHIPKVAGTSLLSILRSQYPEVTRLANKGGWRKFKKQHAESVKYCLSAHMPYGLHRRFDKPTEYICFFRDPIDRLMSQYHYVQKRGKKSIWFKPMQGMSLEEFLLSDLHDNTQVRHLAGMNDVDMHKRNRPINQARFDTARRNLETIRHIGFQETFAQDVSRIASRVQWVDIEIPTMLQSNNPGQNALPDELKEKLIDRCAWDYKLIEFARQLV